MIRVSSIFIQLLYLRDRRADFLRLVKVQSLETFQGV